MGNGIALVLAVVAVIALLTAVAAVTYMVRASRGSQSAAGTTSPSGAVGAPADGGGGGRPLGDQEQAGHDRAGNDRAGPDGPGHDVVELDRRGVVTLQAAEAEADAIVRKAEEAAERAAEVRRELDEEVRAVTAEIRQLRGDLERREERISEREERLDEEVRRVEQLARSVDEVRMQLDDRRAELDQLDVQRQAELERIAGLTAGQAKTELMAAIEQQAKREAALMVRDIEGEAKKEGQQRARKIVTLAIQRVASEQTSESVVSVLHLPADDMKGRIIGREGRNIRAFETVTGVNLIIDDTPEAVLLSCFDPVRREVGKLTLERLVADGRIHPQRIEEAYEQSRTTIQELCVRAGEDALIDLGITDMHPELTQLLGQLRYRTSYGQNVLKHLVESAHIAGMMASELGLDPGAAQARHAIARHRQGADARSAGQPRADRRRDRAPVWRARGCRARHRGASQRGRGQDRRGRADTGRRRDQRRAAWRAQGVA